MVIEGILGLWISTGPKFVGNAYRRQNLEFSASSKYPIKCSRPDKILPDEI
jgi:hypothetical protein